VVKMDEIKKSSKKIFSSKFKMKIIFAKNAFGGHYEEKILKKFCAKKDLLEFFFQTNNLIRIKHVLKPNFNLMLFFYNFKSNKFFFFQRKIFERKFLDGGGKGN